MADKIDTRIVQVSNIAPNATRDQMKTLFSYLGRIDEMKMYPTEALVVVPCMEDEIPDEQSALQRAPQAVAGMLPGQPTWPTNVISQLQSVGGSQVIITNDPRLTALGLSQYPPLPSNTDPGKIEEIRRTVYVSNLDPAVTGEQIMSFFTQVGEIKYVRMGGEDVEGGKCAYIEFTDQRSIATALTYNGEAAQREIDEAMKKVKEAQSLITAAADSEVIQGQGQDLAGIKVDLAHVSVVVQGLVAGLGHEGRDLAIGQGRGDVQECQADQAPGADVVVVPVVGPGPNAGVLAAGLFCCCKRQELFKKEFCGHKRQGLSKKEDTKDKDSSKKSSEDTKDKDSSKKSSVDTKDKDSPKKSSVDTKDKDSSKKRSPSRGRSRSRSRDRRRRSRSKSKGRKTTKSRHRSRSGSRRRRSRSRKKSRSRSGSRHRSSRKDKKKERDRSRERDKKKKHKEKDRDRDEKKENKVDIVKRDYDEEEQILYEDVDKEKKAKASDSTDDERDSGEEDAQSDAGRSSRGQSEAGDRNGRASEPKPPGISDDEYEERRLKPRKPRSEEDEMEPDRGDSPDTREQDMDMSD
ncbi:RSP7-like protein [Mya arenaria]|uniref:RSP7-like protein n=1 Tax=Mya arenaria TaxID=6604 RepID=A0ABY7FQP3_MYAAR|nr:RSP7-like protein [Mya arenaria]